MIFQTTFRLKPYSRGFHLITDIVEAEMQALLAEHSIKQGIMHLFIQHTSAGLTINENADPDVRTDFEAVFSKRIMPEHEPYLTHTLEGPDDMPAHIKSSLIGASVQIPITEGHLNLGTWQGIYLGEFRNHGGARKLHATTPRHKN